MIARESALADIDVVLTQYEAVELEHGHAGRNPDDFDLAAPQVVESKLITLMLAAISRHAPPRSPYASQAAVARQAYALNDSGLIRELAGILQALRADYEGDRLRPFQELVHSDLFADMLEAAEHLLGETYKDPAAVIAGGVLEQHLRELCRKHGIDITFINRKGETKPKMLDAMNADLAKAGAYGTIEQKEVITWAGIRNAAAHGKYGDYDQHQVQQVIAGIRQFIVRHPA